MTVFVSRTTLDCRDAHALAEFWREALGSDPAPGLPYGPGLPVCELQDPATGERLRLREVPQEQLPPMRGALSLDLRPRSGTRDAEVQRLLSLGAAVHEDARGLYGPATGWWVLADPEGNTFRVLRSVAELIAMDTEPEAPLEDTVVVPGWGRMLIGAYAFPGSLRETLIEAILEGRKIAASFLLEQHRRTDEPLPQVGDAEAVIDSEGIPVCITVTTDVQVRRLADVDDSHAAGEGEGYADARAWRISHESFWTSPRVSRLLGDPPVLIDDDTEVVCVRFEVADRL